MKELSLSICAIAGSIMAVGGSYVENMESTRRVVKIDGVGMSITIISSLLVAFLVFRDFSGKSP